MVWDFYLEVAVYGLATRCRLYSSSELQMRRLRPQAPVLLFVWKSKGAEQEKPELR